MKRILTVSTLALVLLLSSCAAPAAESTDAPVDETHQLITISDDYKAPDTVFLEVQARLLDSEDRSWQTELTAHDGDIIELQAQYANFTDTDHDCVYVGFNLPSSLEYVDETFTLYNSNYLAGLRYKGDISSVNIGPYPGTSEDTPDGQPGSNAFFYIQVIVHADSSKTLPVQFIATCNGANDTIRIANTVLNLKIE